MLVISRRLNESVIIDDDTEIVVTRIDRDKVRLAIQAPKEIKVYRKEIYKGKDSLCGKK